MHAVVSCALEYKGLSCPVLHNKRSKVEGVTAAFFQFIDRSLKLNRFRCYFLQIFGKVVAS